MYNTMERLGENTVETQNTEKILSILTSINSVSGDENRMFEAIDSFFDEDACCDSMNSVIVHTQKGVSKKRFLLDAHLDQIGFVVTDITEHGFVKVGAVGGIDKRTLCATDVVIHADNEDVFGVVTSVPPHLSGKNDGEAAEITDILIDVAMSKSDAEKVISKGDIATFNYRFLRLNNDCVTAPSLDNKAGVAVLIRSYQLLKEECPEACVSYLFSSQEEVGMRGSCCACFGIEADESIVVDVSFATAPNVDKTHAGELKSGPMICVSPVIDKKISDGLIECAKENRIAYQTEICSNATGTNADVISLSGCGIKTGLVSVPLRNMHTFSEVISLSDVELSARLIAEYVKRRVRCDD